MNREHVHSAIKSCQSSDQLLSEAENLVAIVINNAFNGTFQAEHLMELLCRFRSLAQKEGINLENMTDLDLYMFVVRPVAGCID